MVRLAGGKPVNVKTYNKDEFRLLPEHVNEAITDKTRMIIINSPSNPTGSVEKKDDIKGIAELAMDHDLLVLSDEIYEKLIYEGEHHSIAAIDGMFERSVTINGFSKAFAMTGWRLGWAIAPNEIFEAMSKIQQHSISCCTSFAQKGGVAALSGSMQSVNDMIKEFKARRDLVVHGLNQIEGISCFMPKGAFYAFFNFDYDMSSEEFTNYLLKEGGLVLTPGSAFGPGGKGFVRLSYAASQEKLKRGLEKLEQLVSQL
jgi:aspartate aminotransferase